MKIILATLGTSGDLNPFYAMGLELKKRGHDILFLSSSFFEEEIKNLGFAFRSIGDKKEWEQILELFNPDEMAEFLPKEMKYLVLDSMRPLYEAISQEYEKDNTVIVNWQILAGSRIAQDKLGIPVATIVLAPSSFRSTIHFPRMGIKKVPQWLPRIYFKKIYKIIDSFNDKILKTDIDTYRKELGLEPINTTYDWLQSQDTMIGLFPHWFGEKQKDWPSQSVTTTFPFFDKSHEKKLSTEIIEFLENGEPPIVFTPGSHFKKSLSFFQAAVDACERLNKRGILLAKYKEQIPDNLPQTIKHFTYAEFSELLPRVALFVHHGGIGSCAQAFRAGIPQIAVPWALDQFDNASRIQNSGVGDEIVYWKLTGKKLAKKIDKLLSSQKVHQKCKKYAELLLAMDPLKETCDIIESLVKKEKP